MLEFIAALVIAYVIPGPDFAFVLASATRSRRLGRAAATGVVTGLTVHATLAAAGVSSLLAATSWGLPALRIVGAGFLVWAGVITLRSGGHARAEGGTTAGGAYRRGLLGNLLNPKTLLFFIALIPQFVDPGHAYFPQVAKLAAITVVSGVVWWTIVVLVAGRLVAPLAEPRVRRRLDLGTGFALLGLAGLVAAL